MEIKYYEVPATLYEFFTAKYAYPYTNKLNFRVCEIKEQKVSYGYKFSFYDSTIPPRGRVDIMSYTLTNKDKSEIFHADIVIADMKNAKEVAHELGKIVEDYAINYLNLPFDTEVHIYTQKPFEIERLYDYED